LLLRAPAFCSQSYTRIFPASRVSSTKDSVERDLQEVNQTALNGWDIDYVERIKMSIEEIKMN
jgi:hypothetical protein